MFNSKDEFPNKFSDIIGMFEGAVKNGVDNASAKVYNGEKKYALTPEWHPDITPQQLARLMKKIEFDIKHSKNSITETSNWMFTDIYGLNVFAFYSTENREKPTLLYESKGDKAIKERDILLKILEVYNNVGSINRESDFVDRLLGGNWM